ncbi:MAG TPA: 2-phospho-L-lactate transferase [Dehalococcoidia bacterium]|nr:2-phospho-L-lactate transferase [Dehalococcoidia bacterium]
MIVALAGGYGGSKLAQGLYRVLPPGELTVIVNTADDLTLFGLRVCPDLDTVMYTLAGLVNRKEGWGVKGDSFHGLAMLGRYGEPTWFRLGDRDMATHLLRTRLLAEGRTLTEATHELCRRLGITATVLPMCNEPVATQVDTPEGTLSFQEYFVGRDGRVKAEGLRYHAIEGATLTEEVVRALHAASRVIICPSNPLLSVGPILSVPGLRGILHSLACPMVAVSPLIGGKALRGPLARLLADLGHPATQAGIAHFYADFLDGLVIDRSDAGEASQLDALGVSALVTSTVMTGPASREALARRVLGFEPARPQV